MVTLLRENQIIILGLLLLGGFGAGKAIRLLKLPAITGYVLCGILLGSGMSIIRRPMVHHLRFIEVLGLSMVALIIGSDLNNRKLRRLGKSVIIITLTQVAGAFFIVTLVMRWLLHVPLHTALLLGAIGSATAPAATVAVIHEYKAHGPLTDTLMAIVALDDAVCVILFGIALAVSGILLNGAAHDFSWIKILKKPLWEIGGSMACGIVVGFLVIFLLRKVKEKHEVVVVLLGFAFLAGEMGEIFGLSSLLLNMSYGYILTNFSSRPHISILMEDIELPILICFFTLAGATLNVSILLRNWAAAMAFILARGAGKVLGTYLGGRLSHASESVKKYLGLAMLPQAGVAIALVMVIGEQCPQIAPLITALVLASVTFNEIFGPVGTKIAIVASGEDGRDKKGPHRPFGHGE
ncbi:MAG: cation:proton antiporter [bacterium]